MVFRANDKLSASHAGTPIPVRPCKETVMNPAIHCIYRLLLGQSTLQPHYDHHFEDSVTLIKRYYVGERQDTLIHLRASYYSEVADNII